MVGTMTGPQTKGASGDIGDTAPDVGIMQGRLVPPIGNRIQCFPADNWRDEFPRAAEAGLACIEWIYEEDARGENPLDSPAGQDAIQTLAARHGVAVRSVCADHFMVQRLVAPDGRPDPDAQARLSRLIPAAAAIGAEYIVLPFVDRSSLATAAEQAGLRAALAPVLDAAERHRVELHLETDLPPGRFREVLESIGSPQVLANHDIGNSASLGFDPREEIATLAPWIASVHVKDRQRGGGTVPLGQGDADLPLSLTLLREAGFRRWLILQVARGETGGETELAAANRRAVQSWWRGERHGS